MLEKIIKDKRELNRAAAHLRSQEEFDRIRKLAEEWMVPDAHVEAFIAGKRILLADIDIEEKDYANAKAKLAEELHLLSDEHFADIIGVYLCRKCQDREYEALVLQKHKTLQKCLNYVLEKAHAIAEGKRGETGTQSRQGIGVAVTSTEVFQWVDEYYALDDEKEEAEKKEKARADFVKNKKKQAEMKKKRENQEVKKKQNEKKKEERERKKKEAEQNVQMTFDFLSEPKEEEPTAPEDETETEPTGEESGLEEGEPDEDV